MLTVLPCTLRHRFQKSRDSTSCALFSCSPSCFALSAFYFRITVNLVIVNVRGTCSWLYLRMGTSDLSVQRYFQKADVRNLLTDALDFSYLI